MTAFGGITRRKETARLETGRVDWRRVLVRVATILGFLGALWIPLIIGSGSAGDTHAYWAMNAADPYGSRVGTPDAFLYSPVAVFVLAPFTLLPWPVFYGLFVLLTALALVWLAGPWTLPLLLFPPVMIELWNPNIHLLLAVAIVAGFRWPGAWAFVLLTKLTPGVGLLWFAVRREWRNLAIALGVTVTLVGVTFVLAPRLWLDWIATLREGSAWNVDQIVALNMPLLPRLVVAAGVVTVGALRGWRWAVPIAAMLAVPVVWVNALAILAALRRTHGHPPGWWAGRGDARLVRLRATSGRRPPDASRTPGGAAAGHPPRPRPCGT